MKYFIVISLALVAAGTTNASMSEFTKIIEECMAKIDVTQEQIMQSYMKKELSDKIVELTDCSFKKLGILDADGALHPEVFDKLIEEGTELCQSGNSDACHALGTLHKTKKCASTYTPENDSPHPVSKGLLRCIFQD